LEFDERTRLLPGCQDRFDKVMMEADALFEQCTRQEFWDLAIRLAGEHPAWSLLWANLLCRQWAPLPAVEASNRLRRLIVQVGPIGIGEVVMVVENFRLNRTWARGWPLDRVADAYRVAVENRDLDPRIRVEFIAALAYLRRSGAAGETGRYREWFAENASDRSYFDEVLALL
jgi:hypothetical protein